MYFKSSYDCLLYSYFVPETYRLSIRVELSQKVFLYRRTGAAPVFRWLLRTFYEELTLNLLKTTIVAPPSNASKWQMGFNSAFKGCMKSQQIHQLFIQFINYVW